MTVAASRSGGGTASLADRLRAHPVIPVVELPRADLAVPLVEALVGGGIGCVEITMRTAAAAEGIAAIRSSHPDVLLGAGTVLTGEQLDAVAELGVDFVVSPGTSPPLVERCLARGLPILPGVCTPTEIDLARSYGLEVLKFFPAEAAGGVRFLRALAGPYREVAFVPTGGVDASNLAEYLALPQVIACGGSWLATPELLLAGDFDRVRALAGEASRIARAAR